MASGEEATIEKWDKMSEIRKLEKENRQRHMINVCVPWKGPQYAGGA